MAVFPNLEWWRVAASRLHRGGGTELAKKGDRDNAEYIAGMCNELAELAKRSGFATGAYLLKMASLEFEKQQVRSGRIAPK